MSTAPIAQGPVDVNVGLTATQQLAEGMARKTDDVLRQAVTQFLGTDWKMDELKGRAVMQRLPNGIEVFCLDGVALVEVYPITLEYENKGGSMVATAARQHRFLVPNA